MACSIPVPHNPILEESENSEASISDDRPDPVGDSAEPATAVAVDLGVSGPEFISSELDDGGTPLSEKAKAKKVTFVTVKHVDSTVDLEKGLDVKDVGEPTDKQCGEDDQEKVCRVCHLSSDNRSGPGDLILIGCGCKDDLGTAHKHCAEVWFKIRGNRLCEICGETAKNVVGVGDAEFMEEWNERDVGNSSSSETPRCWRGRPLCNFLMACMVVAFVLPWFFRVSMF